MANGPESQATFASNSSYHEQNITKHDLSDTVVSHRQGNMNDQMQDIDMQERYDLDLIDSSH